MTSLLKSTYASDVLQHNEGLWKPSYAQTPAFNFSFRGKILVMDFLSFSTLSDRHLQDIGIAFRLISPSTKYILRSHLESLLQRFYEKFLTLGTDEQLNAAEFTFSVVPNGQGKNEYRNSALKGFSELVYNSRRESIQSSEGAPFMWHSEKDKDLLRSYEKIKIEVEKLTRRSENALKLFLDENRDMREILDSIQETIVFSKYCRNYFWVKVAEDLQYSNWFDCRKRMRFLGKNKSA